MKKVIIALLLSTPLLGQTTGSPLNLNLPVQGSPGWGAKLNQNFTIINSFATNVVTFPGTAGIVYSLTSNSARNAVFGDVVGLWSGCSGGYLMFNGTCSTPVGGITSITWSLPPFLAASPVTLNASGTQAFTLATQSANRFFAGPTTGPAAAPDFRVIVPADLPVVSSSAAGAAPASGGGTTNFLRADGAWAAPPGGGGTGTVTSVDMVIPAWAGLSGNPITTSGTFTITLPPFLASGVTHAPGIVPDPGASAGTTKYLREDGTWTVPPGGSASPGGSSGQMQFNDSGSFGGVTGTTVTAGSLAALTVSGSGGSVLASGIIDGHTATEVTSATTVSVGTSTSGPCAPNACLGEYIFNNATGSTTFTLPTAEAGRQYCFRNATGKTNVIIIATSASGQFIDNQGVNTASGGNITSSGALGDSVCVVGTTSTQWYSLIQSGIWTTN